jgi:hypothetical protein
MIEGEVRKKAFTMPITNPSYPVGPYRFTDREYMIISYYTDSEALEHIVPEPLELVDTIVRYEFIRMPDSTGFGNAARACSSVIADGAGALTARAKAGSQRRCGVGSASTMLYAPGRHSSAIAVAAARGACLALPHSNPALSSFSHQLECAPNGGQIADWELTGTARLSKDESHGQAPHLQH